MILFAVEGPEDERDTDRRKSAYVSGKEFRLWVVVFIIAMLSAYYFLYLPWKKHRDFVVARNNLNVIYAALNTYASDNSDGLPPTYIPNIKDKYGNPITWASTLMDSMKDAEAFHDPSSPQEGCTPTLRRGTDGSETTIDLSYGMLAAVSAIRKYEMRDDTIIFAMTLGSGVLDSYNPMPLAGADGFLIGYDNSNSAPNAETSSATRLAFADNGKSSIHGAYGIAGIRADGSTITMPDSSAARVNKRGNVPTGQWVPN